MRILQPFALLLACLPVLAAALTASAGESAFFPKRLLVNNDGTNMFWRDDLTPEMVKRRVAECPDAVTTYLLCPNSIQKMMYPSDLEEMSQRGALPELVKAGEDPFGLFLTELKTRKMEVFITYRMNEVENVDKKDPDLCAFWRTHPDWRVEPGAPLDNQMAQCLDYSRNEVQDRAVAQVCELLEKYRPDGIELDWMRFPRHLSGDAEKVWTNRGMLSDVVAAVKLKANELAERLGRPVLVSVRIPSSMAGCHALGVDLVDWTQRKLVDFVTAAPFLASDFSMPIGEMRAAMGDAKVPIYGCIEFGYSGKPHTEATLHAAALGLYESGADGIYLFNFPCWRETQEAPPWSWVPQLKDPALLTCNTLEFPLINGTNRMPDIDIPALLPVTLQPGESKTLPLTLPRAVVDENLGLRGGHTPPAPPMAGGVCPAISSLDKITAVRFTCEASDGVEAKLNGEVPSATAVRPGENTVELRNPGTEAVTVTEARLALELPSVPPTVFPDLPEEQCVHVSPGGSDDNTGTLEKPVATIRGANKLLGGKSGDVCIWLHAGTYSRGWSFPNSNWARHLYIRAWPGDKVTISNGNLVTKWESLRNGQWHATTFVGGGGYQFQLFVNGKRAQRARGNFPEGATVWGDVEHIDGVAGYRLPDDSMAGWGRPEDIMLGYFTSWGHMTCGVSRFERDADGHFIAVMQQPAFYIGLHKEGVRIEYPAYIENAYELLDKPGEYYFFEKDRELIYMPREGEDMNTVQSILAFEGNQFIETRNLWIEGVTFADAVLDSGDNSHMDVQANFTFDPGKIFERDGAIVTLHNEYLRSPAAFLLYNARDCRFVHCTFTRFPGAGLDMQRGSRGIVVDGCIFEDIGGSAIQIGDVTTRDHHPTDPKDIVRDNVITNCTIRNCGVEFEGSVGIFVGYANGTVISNNEIHDLPYSGISVGWGWGEEDVGGGAYPIPYTYATPTPAGANRIEYNHIHNVMQKRDDGGGVYTLGNQPGTVIRGNYIHDNGPGGPGGIYLDEGSGYIEITGNVLHHMKNPMNYNNAAQDRRATCFEHDNSFGPTPGDADFPEETAKHAGPVR
jgi:hypothetical protein